MFGYNSDLVFIPFTFTLQAWFLVDDTTVFPLWQKALIIGTWLLGYIIFRFANKQKHDFKKNPSAPVWGRKPETIGGRLLVSGWWGLASHIKYVFLVTLELGAILIFSFTAIWVT